jgi:hypothetical protein
MATKIGPTRTPLHIGAVIRNALVFDPKNRRAGEAPHLSPTDLAEVRRILAETQPRIARFEPGREA